MRKRKNDVVYLPLHRGIGEYIVSEVYWVFNNVRIAQSLVNVRAYVGYISHKSDALFKTNQLNVISMGVGRDRTLLNDVRFYLNILLNGLREYTHTNIFHHYGSFGFAVGLNPFFMIMPKFGRKYIIGPILYPSRDEVNTLLELSYVDKIHNYGKNSLKFLRIANYLTLLRANVIIFDCLQTREMYIKIFPPIERKKFEIIPGGGISNEEFPTKKYHSNFSQPLTFGIASNFIKRKNIDLFIKALSKFKGAVLKIAGRGPEEINLKALTYELKLNDTVEFIGSVEHEVLWYFYHGIDIYVALDDGPTEVKISAQEAMISGTPIISGQSTHKNTTKIFPWGIEVNPFSESNLEESINFFLNNLVKISEMGKEASKYAIENFSDEAVKQKLKLLYENI